MGYFEDVFRALNKAKVRYLVVGGVAVNIYGHPRFTGDIDILLLLESEQMVKGKKHDSFCFFPAERKSSYGRCFGRRIVEI